VSTHRHSPTVGISDAQFVQGHGTGFSLIEMLIVMVIIGLLLTIAVPQYQKFVQRGYRVEAISMLTGAAACQERIRADTGSYDPNRCTHFGQDNRYYQLLSSPVKDDSIDGFVLIAEPVNSSEVDDCGSLGLDHTGARTITGPAKNLWPCWSGR